MQNISAELSRIITESAEAMKKLSKPDWDYRRGPGKWTRKQILGHLIDSAANNHQRFVRVLFEDTPFIRYDGDNWVAVQDYLNEPAEALIDLWLSYNHHLAYVITKVPENKFNNLCNIGKDKPVTIEWIIIDYLRHLKHHLGQIIS